MSDPSQSPYFRQAQQLEKQGRLNEAIQSFVHAGAISEAARILMSQRQFEQAGNLLMRHLGAPPSQVGKLRADKRKEAFSAAICYARTDKYLYAVELYMALGEHPRALELLERNGEREKAQRLREHLNHPSNYAQKSRDVILGGETNQFETSGLGKAQALEKAGNLNEALNAYAKLKKFADAGRVAEKIGGITDRAAKYYIDAGMPFEAAQCYIKVGETGKALDTICRVPTSDQRYKVAATTAIGLAVDLGVLDFGLEQFVGDYIDSDLSTDADLETLYRLATLYIRHSHLENALETFGRIANKNASFKDVATQIEGLKNRMQQSPRVYERILREEASFRERDRAKYTSGAPAPVEQLPDLPDLPGLPPVPSPQDLVSSKSQGRPLPQGREEKGTFMRQRSAFESEQLDAAAIDQTIAPNSAPPPPPAAAPEPAGDVNEMFQAGNTIGERYQLEKRIGKGGMAYVFRAKDTELDELIALKVFQQPIEDDEQLLHRFKQELVLSRKLAHNNIIQLFDIGIHRGYRYISMELLSGDELKAQLGKPIDLAKGIDYLIQACDGLQYAHDKGIIHRDVKPQNFFVTEENVLKVMDFGIAKQGGTEGKTVAGMIAGTPNYMSPEQINGFSNVTPATDIYAMGCIAYEMFTGDVPFSHAELMPLLMMHMTKPPVPPSQHNPGIPPPLEKMILKLLEKDPANRYSSCRAFADDLRRLRGA